MLQQKRKDLGGNCLLMSTKLEHGKEKSLTAKVPIPEGVQVSFQGAILHVKGTSGELTKFVGHPYLTLTNENNAITLKTKKNTKKYKRIIYSMESHVKNALSGVIHPYFYRLKICSGHFPMTVKQDAQKITISNFLGEKIPRVASILPNVKVKIEGEMITIESPDIEAAGQTAANLETATRITARDRRVFQDGIFIIEKPAS